MIVATWTDPQDVEHRFEVLGYSHIPGMLVCTENGKRYTVNQPELRNVTKIPQHLSEQVFRRYEPVLEKLVKNPGKTLTLHSTERLSSRTIAARLRDAINSCIIYKWQGNVDPVKLAELRSTFTIKTYVDAVEIAFRTPVETVEAGESVAEVVLEGLDLLDLYALARLLSKRHLRGPYRLLNVSKEHVTEVQSNHDIAIVENQDHSITML